MVEEHEITNSEAAVLGLLAEKPSYGYEIEATIQERGMSEWTEIAFSSIYYLLRRLEEKGLVESEMVHEGSRPPKKIYRPTKEGIKTLRSSAVGMMSTPKKVKSDLDVAVALVPLLKKTEIIEALGRYEKYQRDRREKLKKKMTFGGGDQLPYFVRALFERPLAHIETELRWIKKFRGQVDKEHERMFDPGNREGDHPAASRPGGDKR